MTKESGEVYNQILDQNETNLLIQKLIKESGNIIIRFDSPEKDVFLMKPVALLHKEKLKVGVTLVKGTALIENQSRPVIFHFTVEDKKIIGCGEIKKEDSSFHLTINRPIFIVQRREHFRLRLPAACFAYCVIPSFNEKIKFRIADISAGGILLEDEKLPTNFRSKQKFEVSLHMPGKEPVRIETIVRRPATETNRKMGLKFEFSSKDSEREMVGLVMELYHQFFK
jgi:hypothetical protein